MEAVVVDNVSKTFRIATDPADSLKQRILRFRRGHFEEFQALHDLDLVIEQGETVGILGHNGSGKSTLLEVHRRHPHADHRRGARARPAGVAARARRRLPSRPHRPRERLHQRQSFYGMTAQGGRPGLRRHRRLLRPRPVHRRAGEALLVGHVRAPRFRRGGQPRPRRAARRRGARRRRRGVPGEVHRSHPPVPGRGTHDRVRHPRRRDRAPGVQPGRSCSTTARW